jgi:hypothetical protein
MDRHTFKTTINASREKVWDVLWGDDTYPKWTSVFSEGSKAESDWKEGSKILFTDGKGSGMVSKIESKKSPEYMSFKHLGEMKNGVEDVSEKRTGMVRWKIIVSRKRMEKQPWKWRLILWRNTKIFFWINFRKLSNK